LDFSNKSGGSQASGAGGEGGAAKTGSEGALNDNDDELYVGVYRITRHPGLWGLGLFGLGAAVLSPFIAEIVFFAMPCAFALIGGAHQVRGQRQCAKGVR
jgi:hypothetical protein